MACVMLIRVLILIGFLRIIGFIFDLICAIATGVLRGLAVSAIVGFFLYASWVLGSFVWEVIF